MCTYTSARGSGTTSGLRSSRIPFSVREGLVLHEELELDESLVLIDEGLVVDARVMLNTVVIVDEWHMLGAGLVLAHSWEYVVLDDGLGLNVCLVSRDGVVLEAGLILKEGLMLCMGVMQCIKIDG